MIRLRCDHCGRKGTRNFFRYMDGRVECDSLHACVARVRRQDNLRERAERRAELLAESTAALSSTVPGGARTRVTMTVPPARCSDPTCTEHWGNK